MDKSVDVPRLLRLDLNLFRVFDVVYRERNLTRAAAVLSLSQSAVSHSLARLREVLQDPLFVRRGRGVAPTPRAEQLAPAVQQALAALRQGLQRGRAFDPAHDLTRLRLAMHEELEPNLLPAVFERLRVAAPAAAIASVRLDRANLKADLAAGRVDLAIDVAQVTEPELRHEPLLQDSLCVVSAAARRRLDFDSYMAAQHIAVSSRRTGPAMEDFMFGRQGLQRQIVLRCQHYESACRIAAASDLLLTIPRRNAESLRTAALRLWRMPLELPPIELHLYWHRQAELEPATLWLRSELRALAGKNSGR
ncbi:MAG: LysR family transcriptional regulator [Nevskia sp.]|nr:LysR family transcriptional regulator [Nevskia sp.]